MIEEIREKINQNKRELSIKENNIDMKKLQSADECNYLDENEEEEEIINQIH
jgi:hypothetical protein